MHLFYRLFNVSFSIHFKLPQILFKKFELRPDKISRDTNTQDNASILSLYHIEFYEKSKNHLHLQLKFEIIPRSIRNAPFLDTFKHIFRDYLTALFNLASFHIVKHINLSFNTLKSIFS